MNALMENYLDSSYNKDGSGLTYVLFTNGSLHSHYKPLHRFDFNSDIHLNRFLWLNFHIDTTDNFEITYVINLKINLVYFTMLDNI